MNSNWRAAISVVPIFTQRSGWFSSKTTVSKSSACCLRHRILIPRVIWWFNVVWHPCYGEWLPGGFESCWLECHRIAGPCIELISPNCPYAVASWELHKQHMMGEVRLDSSECRSANYDVVCLRAMNNEELIVHHSLLWGNAEGDG